MKALNPSTGQFETIYVKALDSLPVGIVLEYPTTDSSKLPTGYMFCDGSAISRTEYSELFGLIGTKFGVGDGSTTFNLPTKAGLVSVGINSNDTDFDNIGETGGSKYLQEHTHRTAANLNHNSVGLSGSQVTGAVDYGAGTQLYTEGVYNLTTGNSGNLQPYTVTNYIIKVKQTRPLAGTVVNTYSESQTSAYSCDYVNGTVLYENNSGTTGNVTLSDSVNNYRYIEIYYGTTGSGINCVKIIPSITNNCNFTSFNITGGTTYIYSTQTTISGTSITITAYARGPISSIAYDANFNSIFKVIGYK